MQDKTHRMHVVVDDFFIPLHYDVMPATSHFKRGKEYRFVVANVSDHRIFKKSRFVLSNKRDSQIVIPSRLQQDGLFVIIPNEIEKGVYQYRTELDVADYLSFIECKGLRVCHSNMRVSIEERTITIK